MGAIKRNESPSKLLVSFFPLSPLPVAKNAFKLNKLFGCFCFYLGLHEFVNLFFYFASYFCVLMIFVFRTQVLAQFSSENSFAHF